MKILHGDSLCELRSLPSASIDSLVTDPPAGIAFMGKDWDKDKGGRGDWVAWMTSVMVECLRVLKPGAYGLVWALPRTSHWTATALEDAGFEVRDIITHLFSTGFPKSTNGLKPACEFWVLVRKRCSEKSVKANVERYGTGQLNIETCRIGTEPMPFRRAASLGNGLTMDGGKANPDYKKPDAVGRFPANLVLDDEAAIELGEAARYFYIAKASKADRGAGNTHPTVKSTKLMSYLLKLITPAGGTVLDPFMGSGSTGVAAIREKLHFVGIESEADYYKIATQRLQLEAG